MKVAIVTGASQGIHIAQRAIRQMVAEGGGHIVQRHDRLEEQWSFFVKKCVPNPTRATS
jgi:hypothetical protein